MKILNQLWAWGLGPVEKEEIPLLKNQTEGLTKANAHRLSAMMHLFAHLGSISSMQVFLKERVLDLVAAFVNSTVSKVDVFEFKCKNRKLSFETQLELKETGLQYLLGTEYRYFIQLIGSMFERSAVSADDFEEVSKAFFAAN